MEDLRSTAARVLGRYPLQPESIQVIQAGNIKTVWRVEAEGGPYCLKRLRQEPARASFTVAAQIYLFAGGGPVARVFPASNGDHQVVVDDHVFVLYEWLDGHSFPLTTANGLERALNALGQFHASSRGFTPPPDCRVSRKLDRWPARYASLRGRLEDWRRTAQENRNDPFCAVYLEQVEAALENAKRAEIRLARSDYSRLMQSGEVRPVLCHQDFGEGNVISGPTGTFVIDLDNVTFDFPARDLRKVVNKTMLDRRAWDLELLRRMLAWYGRANRLEALDLELLAIDLTFPHLFHDAAKNRFRKGKTGESVSRLRQVQFLEQNKPDFQGLASP